MSERFLSECRLLRMRNKSERELCPNEIDPNGGAAFDAAPTPAPTLLHAKPFLLKQAKVKHMV
jgi:hypothetical protein